MPYRISYSRKAKEHLRVLTTRQQVIVLDSVDKQLMYQPTLETQNRKLMRSNPIAPWELRIGNLRVYYDVSEEDTPTVLIQAVGVKDRNKVRIGNEEVQL